MNDATQKKALKVIADATMCCGYGLCAQMCPEIYKLDENGIVYLETDTVPEELLDAAIEGAECCPAQALQVIADDAD